MIAFVSGKVVSRAPTELVLDVNGIGYQILVPTSTFEKVPPAGQTATLLTHHYVREDTALLYGFATEAERETFKILIGVSGVGPRLALAALSALSPAELSRYVLAEDPSMLTRIPGVGRKKAERMIVELKDRLSPMSAEADDSGLGDGAVSALSDARAALEALGFSKTLAAKSLKSVIKKNPAVDTAEDLIRLALRES